MKFPSSSEPLSASTLRIGHSYSTVQPAWERKPVSEWEATAGPTIDELMERARTLLPRLAERASHTEELRQVPDETIRDFREAGLFRVVQPARYGGYEMDYGTTPLELAGLLGPAR